MRAFAALPIMCTKFSTAFRNERFICGRGTSYLSLMSTETIKTGGAGDQAAELLAIALEKISKFEDKRRRGGLILEDQARRRAVGENAAIFID